VLKSNTIRQDFSEEPYSAPNKLGNPALFWYIYSLQEKAVAIFVSKKLNRL